MSRFKQILMSYRIMILNHYFLFILYIAFKELAVLAMPVLRLASRLGLGRCGGMGTAHEIAVCLIGIIQFDAGYHHQLGQFLFAKALR